MKFGDIENRHYEPSEKGLLTSVNLKAMKSILRESPPSLLPALQKRKEKKNNT